MQRAIQDKPIDTGWPTFRGILTAEAWETMMDHAGEVTPAVIAWADQLAHGGEILPAHITSALEQQRAALAGGATLLWR